MSGPLTSTGKTPHDNWTTSAGRDARTGLGYGVLNPKTQLPRQMSPEFPYTRQEDTGDEDFDEESTDAVAKKYSQHVPSDFLRAAGSQPFYFVGGNTKLSDCFWRTEYVLQEIATFSDSMSPLGNAYGKGKGPSIGGSGASFPYQGGGGTNYKRTGTTRGWSHSPPESHLQSDLSAEKDESEEIFTLKDLADKNLRDRGESLQRTHT